MSFVHSDAEGDGVCLDVHQLDRTGGQTERHLMTSTKRSRAADTAPNTAECLQSPNRPETAGLCSPPYGEHRPQAPTEDPGGLCPQYGPPGAAQDTVPFSSPVCSGMSGLDPDGTPMEVSSAEGSGFCERQVTREGGEVDVVRGEAASYRSETEYQTLDGRGETHGPFSEGGRELIPSLSGCGKIAGEFHTPFSQAGRELLAPISQCDEYLGMVAPQLERRGDMVPSSLHQPSAAVRAPAEDTVSAAARPDPPQPALLPPGTSHWDGCTQREFSSNGCRYQEPPVSEVRYQPPQAAAVRYQAPGHTEAQYQGVPYSEDWYEHGQSVYADIRYQDPAYSGVHGSDPAYISNTAPAYSAARHPNVAFTRYREAGGGTVRFPESVHSGVEHGQQVCMLSQGSPESLAGSSCRSGGLSPNGVSPGSYPSGPSSPDLQFTLDQFPRSSPEVPYPAGHPSSEVPYPAGHPSPEVPCPVGGPSPELAPPTGDLTPAVSYTSVIVDTQRYVQNQYVH